MAKINQDLLAAIIKKTGLSRAQAYERIKQTASSEFLPRDLAAIRFGADVGLTINRFANTNELAQLRNAGSPVSPPTVLETTATDNAKTRPNKRNGKPPKVNTPNAVFVIYGRDATARHAMFAFLRSIGIKPIEWTSALAFTKKAAPYIGEILAAAFAKARAIVVLMTPDDLAQLRSDLLHPSDKPYERVLTGQARPNVLFEAGMAFATHPGQTVLVQLGNIREFSDVAGRHVVRLSNDFAQRQELATKLRNAGCDVDTSGTDWVKVGDFVDPQVRTPTSVRRRRHVNKNT